MAWLKDGCVLWLQFDEEKGDVAYDQSGKGNNGDIHGATRVKGKIGGALSFDGVDDYVRTPSINVGSNFSVFGWVKLVGTQKSYPILAANKNSGGTANGWSVWVKATQLKWESGNGTNGECIGSTGFSDITGTFAHTGFVYKDGVIYFYLNGES